MNLTKSSSPPPPIQGTNNVYRFLSGVPITPRSQFMALQSPDVMADFKHVIYYMRYALAAYGWPLYMMMNAKSGLCRIMPHLRLGEYVKSRIIGNRNRPCYMSVTWVYINKVVNRSIFSDHHHDYVDIKIEPKFEILNINTEQQL